MAAIELKITKNQAREIKRHCFCALGLDEYVHKKTGASMEAKSIVIECETCGRVLIRFDVDQGDLAAKPQDCAKRNLN